MRRSASCLIDIQHYLVEAEFQIQVAARRVAECDEYIQKVVNCLFARESGRPVIAKITSWPPNAITFFCRPRDAVITRVWIARYIKITRPKLSKDTSYYCFRARHLPSKR